MNCKLFVVATPIGNYEDITLRALKVLKKVDFVICEEYKSGSKLLNHFEINNQLELLNEHNEQKQTEFILQKMIFNDKSAALISDAGTPLFADPGNKLVRQCHKNDIKVIPIPGPSSLLTALMVSGLKSDKFLYYGFLPANKYERRKALKKVPGNYDIIFLETPYRLKQFLDDLIRVLGKKRNGILAYKLTKKDEKIFWGTLPELKIMTKGLPKGEFVFILKKYQRY